MTLLARDYPDRPWVGIGVVVWRGDHVLLIRRAKPPRQGQWSLPGGAQDVGETVAAGAIREVAEETGVEIALGPLIEVIDAITHDDAGRVLRHYTLLDYVATWVSGEPRGGDDALEAAWFHRDALGPLDLWPETLRIIEKSMGLRSEA